MRGVARTLGCGFVLVVVLFSGSAWGQGAFVTLPNPNAPVLPPHFQGDTIPTPPRQADPWAAPKTTISDLALGAIVDLFHEGLADPRGCEYREIDVVIGDPWSGGGTAEKTAGWVLPSTDAQKFAVCWNGLVYPVVKVGAAADLDKDVAAFLTADKKQIDAAKAQFETQEAQRKAQAEQSGQHYEHIDWPLRWNRNVIPEGMGVSREGMVPMKAVLLLRLGETALAEKVWSQWFEAESDSKETDPYPLLAQTWAFSLFDRAISAHMRGDDHLSLISAKLLATIRQPIESAIAMRHLDRSSGDNKPFLTFLDQLPDLIADEERRIKEGARDPVSMESLMALPQKGPERIAVLIHDLDQVSARQWGQPGGVSLAEDPVVQALISEGEPAVEPLIECFENDTRLTRSVHFWRDFAPEREILGVHEAAYTALASILQTDFFAAGSTGDNLTAHGMEGRKEVAAKIRAYWEKHKGQTLEDRWYQTLGDDKAAPQEWLEAAGDIVQDGDVQGGRSSMAMGGWTIMPVRPPGFIPTMRGEKLRAKTEPSVSDLLLKRMGDLSAPTNTIPDRNLQMKTQLALILAKWDGKAHLDALKDLTGILQAGLIASQNGSARSEIAPILQMYDVRIKLGDPKALAECAAWASSVTPSQVENFQALDFFKILWRHPDDPAVIQAVKDIFEKKDTPWVPLLQKNSQLGFMVQQVFTTPLIGMSGFQTELLRGLHDTNPAGTVTVDADGNGDISVDYGWSGSGPNAVADPLAPAPGKVVPFRVCDLYAWELSQVEGFPKSQPYWPEKLQDRSVAACIAFLQRYGARYAYVPDDPVDEFDPGLDRARFHMPRLDHPATADDVNQGYAIFSLYGKGFPNKWKMPQFPLVAEWPGLKDDPHMTQEASPDGTVKKSITYETRGRVWQSEEEDSFDGASVRFYGFVGPYHLEKVPASEIEFPADNWNRISHEFDCQIDGPQVTWQGNNCTVVNLGPKSPLPMEVKLRNRSGWGQTVPGSWIGQGGDGKQPPEGVHMDVSYSPAILPEAANPEGYATGALKWEPVPPKLLAVEISNGAPESGPLLEPTSEATAFKIDLRDFADFTRTGSYRVEIKFLDDARTKLKADKSAKLTFTVHDP